MRIYCKNRHVVGFDPHERAKQRRGESAKLGGVDLAITAGASTTEGGIILLNDRVATSPTSHEIEISASGVDDLAVGDRVILYIGGDDGGVSANGIAAYHPDPRDGQEAFTVHERFIWAKLKDGELIPRGRTLLLERDDEAMRRYAFNSSPIHAPSSLYQHGIAAANRENPEASGARTRDSVTLQYCRVSRVGPDVCDPELQRGAIVAFSPSFSCTTLLREVRGADGRYAKTFYALADADEVFFAVAG